MVVIQNSINDKSIDEEKLITHLDQLLTDLGKGDSELLLRMVSTKEIQTLNDTYRNKNQPTNVLSFPSDLPEEVDEAILGDVIICLDVVRIEAKQQNKTFVDHLMHMAVHGTLHLLGYDHIQPEEAETMEALEVKILKKMNIANPYL